MTAKQKANRERFKKVVAEAKKLRAKNPKLTQAQAVKQAWAILKKSGKVGEYHKDTKSHNVNIKVVSGLPLSFTGQAGAVKFKVVRQIDIYGNINASVEDIDTGRYIVSADGIISAETLANTFTKYVKKVDPYINVKDVQQRMKRFFIQINKDVKDEQKGKKALKKAAAPRKKAATKKAVKQRGFTNIELDKKRQALPPGKRKSASGKTYYEYRVNRSDKGVLLGLTQYKDLSNPAKKLWVDINKKGLLKFNTEESVLQILYNEAIRKGQYAKATYIKELLNWVL